MVHTHTHNASYPTDRPQNGFHLDFIEFAVSKRARFNSFVRISPFPILFQRGELALLLPSKLNFALVSLVFVRIFCSNPPNRRYRCGGGSLRFPTHTVINTQLGRWIGSITSSCYSPAGLLQKKSAYCISPVVVGVGGSIPTAKLLPFSAKSMPDPSLPAAAWKKPLSRVRVVSNFPPPHHHHF